MEHIKLVVPNENYESQVMSAREDILNLGEHFDGCEGLEDVNSYTEWLDFENRLKARYGQGYVPSDIYLAVTEETDTVVGIIDFRHYLSDFLLQYGGHIGYSVVPAQRRKGYGTDPWGSSNRIRNEQAGGQPVRTVHVSGPGDYPGPDLDIPACRSVHQVSYDEMDDGKPVLYNDNCSHALPVDRFQKEAYPSKGT